MLVSQLAIEMKESVDKIQQACKNMQSRGEIEGFEPGVDCDVLITMHGLDMMDFNDEFADEEEDDIV